MIHPTLDLRSFSSLLRAKKFARSAHRFCDQGLVAVKCLAFGRSVGITLGLPIIRTSVDHRTAFDIAGRGIADQGSMTEAIKLAAVLVESQASR